MIKYDYMLYLTTNKKGVFMEELKIKTIKSSSAKSSSIALSIFLFVWIGVAIYLSGLQIYLLDFTSFETFLLTLFSPYLGVLLAMLGIDIFLIGNIIKEHFLECDNSMFYLKIQKCPHWGHNYLGVIIDYYCL